ncbi:MAG: methanogenesis marker 9 domain-containing protein [Methanobrevibacter sp.]|jgi:putative methanogenesis marker domain 9|nr:methanogenesis marker 9 domain-containing protein [Candidatus Methanovirga meridionalis]
MSWENAPSHICRGGDVRALAFCCPPIKPCPVLHALEDVDITPQEYISIKNEFGKNTRLGEGAGTCFGSLVWCCKSSKPCPLRDNLMRNIGMDEKEYLTLKKQLSDKLVNNKNEDDIEKKLELLSKTFNVSKEIAIKALQNSNNDLKTATKLLKMRSLESEESS